MAWQHALVGLTTSVLISGLGVTHGHADAYSASGKRVFQEMKQSVKPVLTNSYVNNASANHLAKLATQINGVQHATVIVLGNYVVVGLTIDPTLNRHKTGNIKYDVANVIKGDPNGANAFVTSDPNLVQRLKDIRVEILDGKPIQGILQQLALVVERIMPDASSDFLKSRSNSTR